MGNRLARLVDYARRHPTRTRVGAAVTLGWFVLGFPSDFEARRQFVVALWAQLTGAAFLPEFTWLPWVIWIGGIAVIGLSLYVVSGRLPDPPRLPPAPLFSPPLPIPPVVAPPWATERPREYVNEAVTPKYLVDMLDGKTSAQANALAKQYYGAWIRVGGTVLDVDDDPYVSLSLRLGEDQTSGSMASLKVPITVFAKFDEDWKDRVLRVPPRATIRVVGKITRISPDVGGAVSLEHCEIV